MSCSKYLLMGLLVFTLGSTGCSGEPNAPESNASPEAEAPAEGSTSAPHTHGTGPNGGVVFDLGKYHAEFTVDHPKQECYILFIGDDGKTPNPVASEELTLSIKESQTADGTVVAPMTIKMQPQDPQDGKAAKFVGSDPGIGNVADFEGTVLAEIDGKPSQGEFQE